MKTTGDGVLPVTPSSKGRGEVLDSEGRTNSAASPAWPKARTGICTLAIAAACALAFVIVTNHGFSPWMQRERFLAFLRERDGKGTWFTAVEGRWRDGSWQMRVREEPIPENRNIVWSWGYNIASDPFRERLGELSDKGFALVHQQSYRWPDGTKMYQAVWQKNERQEK